MGQRNSLYRKRTTQVKYCGIYLDVEGIYEAAEPQTYDYPGSSAEFDVHKVYVETTDIMDLLSDEQLEDIELLAVESFD
jgi:hypothetical protein|tara:strand:- start:528 stop:764 length:237 start_codon:yes stop_codon:yes gene_type:complete